MMDWKKCCDTKMAKDVKPDQEMINSLVKTGGNKRASEGKLPMDNVTAASKRNQKNKGSEKHYC